jgi:hypothetical protein
MKDTVQRLFVTGAAVVAFGLAPQVFAQQGLICPLSDDDLKMICALTKSYDYVRLESITNTPPVGICGCADREVKVETCSDAVCSNLGTQELAANNASRVSYGDGIHGSHCRKETVCNGVGGDVVCETVRICRPAS